MNTMHTHTSKKQAQARKQLFRLFNDCPLTHDEMLRNLGLFIRGSCLAKMLYIDELYKEIIDIPGIIMEFGVGDGQNQVLFTNLRAIYEPYNYTRLVVGFDFFKSDVKKQYITDLLDYHEMENVLEHITKYELIQGDILQTLPKWLKNNMNIVALAYIDVYDVEVVGKILELISPRLLPGSVVAFDELNNKDYPGETIAYLVNFTIKHTIHKSKFLPDRCYAKVLPK